jgi:alkylation response protein AidB-like acyl-CoA dehydrogenase
MQFNTQSPLKDSVLLDFQQEVKGFIRSSLPDDIRDQVLHECLLLPREMQQRWHKILDEHGGWGCPGWPKEFGGPGWSLSQQYIFEREIALAYAPRPMIFGVTMLGPALMEFGSDEQKEKYLPAILHGDEFWCQGFSEPNAGSDLASLKCRADIQGDEYVLNGSKIWTSEGHYSERMFGLFRTDNSGRKQQGISLLVVDMDAPGISVEPIVAYEGVHEFNQVFFSGVRVPVKNRVGDEHDGWKIAKFILGLERLGIAEVSRSLASLDRLKSLLSARTANGGGSGRTETLLSDMAEIEIDLHALDQLEQTYLFGQGEVDALGVEACLLKLSGTEIQQKILELTMNLYGQEAVMMPENEASFADAGHAMRAHFEFRKTSIYGGSNEIQKNIVAKSELVGAGMS